MNRSIRSLAAGLAAAVCLWPVAASAQDAPQTSSPTVEQIRGVFAGAGFQVDSALNWDWTSPAVSTFRVHDASQGRELMVLVYPDTAAAQIASSQGSRLVVGYGESVWRGNVALVQTTQAELDRALQLQNDRDNGLLPIGSAVVREPGLPSYAVDLDFLQALENSAANL
jgi:hypothetical protein